MHTYFITTSPRGIFRGEPVYNKVPGTTRDILQFGQSYSQCMEYEPDITIPVITKSPLKVLCISCQLFRAKRVENLFSWYLILAIVDTTAALAVKSFCERIY